MRPPLRGPLLAALLAPSPAAAHGGVVAPGEVWGAWSWEPAVLAGVFVAAWLYARGTERVWRRAGVGRGVRRWQAGCFAAGLGVLLVALVSPLDAMGGTLFAAHMVQHELLVLAAAPLLVLGSPLVPFVWGLPPRARRRAGAWARRRPVRAAWRALTHPAVVWALHAAALLVWHAPALYQRTLESDAVHAAQHASFLGTAPLFWWVLLHPAGRRRLAPGAAVLYLFSTATYGAVLGALLTFSPRPWYPAYAPGAAAWGLAPLEDQQIGGLVMWVPGGMAYLAAALALFAAWLRETERRGGAASTGSGWYGAAHPPDRTGLAVQPRR